MNKGKRAILPVVWFLAACATLIRFEIGGEDSRFVFDGLGLGILVAVILAVVLVHRIFRKIEDILMAKGTIEKRVSTPYDFFPILLLILFPLGMQWFGELLPSAAARGEIVHRWVFQWGQNADKFLLYLAILGLILLYRVLRLLAAVARPEPAKD